MIILSILIKRNTKEINIVKQKHILILGAGTAGTIVANKLVTPAKKYDWKVTIVDQCDKHYYQPGFLMYPFGRYDEKDLVRDERDFLPQGVEYLHDGISRIDAEHQRVELMHGDAIEYDLLVIATGSRVNPKETPGMDDGEWGKSIMTFYEFEAAKALREILKNFNQGIFVVHISEMPIKCPVAPLEFSFLADDYFKKRGVREQITIKYVTPLDGAFTKPKASKSLGHLLTEKNIEIIPDFNVERIDSKAKKLISYDGKEVGYDLLITVPVTKGDDVIGRSNLGDELNFVPTDHHTLQSKAHKNIFVMGDATDVPASKAGSVAHFQADTLVDNIIRYLQGQELVANFDGHANCFIETGGQKGLVIDFNYEIEPLEGNFPFPVIGPLRLLREGRLNHVGKLIFRWMYWHIILRGWPIPGISNKMSMLGKKK
ncbi:MAG: oxidoreductase [Bacteroidetes bacterium RIFCSPHIGHO2_02_FULL_44_7]|nr:MAG: oxidoreductase [Bacteroidetes bacterium RIFCSPHIGHO2_02_FULL_44_7]